MGGPDGAVEHRPTQRGHQPQHPRRDHRAPAVAVNGLREVADPLREPVVVAERVPPLEPGRRHRVDHGQAERATLFDALIQRAQTERS
jgi:hypothetical protein